MASKTVLGALTRVSASPAASSSRLAAAASTVAPTASTSSPSTPPPKRYLDFPPLKPLKAKRGIHVATLHLRAHHPTALDLYTTFAAHAARSLQIPTSGIASLPTTRELITVIKSPFVHKKAQENFERRTHRRVIKVFDADAGAVDLWLRYLKRNGIGGVGIKAIVHEYVEYGFASGEIAELEGMLSGGADEVEKAAEELVKSLGGGIAFAEEPEAPKKETEVKATSATEIVAETGATTASEPVVAEEGVPQEASSATFPDAKPSL